MSLKILNFNAGGQLQDDEFERRYQTLMKLVKKNKPQIVVLQNCAKMTFPISLAAKWFKVFPIPDSSNFVTFDHSVEIKGFKNSEKNLFCQLKKYPKTSLVDREHFSCFGYYGGFSFRLTYAHLDLELDKSSSRSTLSVQKDLLSQLIADQHPVPGLIHLVIGNFNLTPNQQNSSLTKLNYLVWDWERLEDLHEKIFKRKGLLSSADLGRMIQCSVDSQIPIVLPVDLRRTYPLSDH